MKFAIMPNGNYVLIGEVAAVELVGYATHVQMRSGQTVRASNDDRRVDVMQRLRAASL